MPIYEYKCCKCDGTFEKLVFGKEEVACPACGGQVERLMSCCNFKSAGGSGGETKSFGTAKSGCGSCSATSCATCH